MNSMSINSSANYLNWSMRLIINLVKYLIMNSFSHIYLSIAQPLSPVASASTLCRNDQVIISIYVIVGLEKVK